MTNFQAKLSPLYIGTWYLLWKKKSKYYYRVS